MTKRQGNSLHTNTSKKSRLDDDLEDQLWGDDPAIEDFDNFLQLAATQLSQERLDESRNNISILPSYSGFRATNNIESSTQNKFEATFCAPTISTVFKKPVTEVKESLQLRIYKLEEQLQSKDGEVSILRNKLNISRTATEAEFAKRQKEFIEKHEKTNKELKLYKCELEFKNLEIANLTKKFSDLVKYNHFNSSVIIEEHSQAIQDVTTSKTVKNDIVGEFKTSHHKDIFYPIQISETMFSSRNRDIYIPISNCDIVNISSVPLLETEVRTVIKRPTIKNTVLTDNSFLSSKNLLVDFLVISKCNNLELEGKENEKRINKILFVLNELLQNTQAFLQEVDENMQPEMVAKLNSMFLDNKFEFSEENISIYDNREWCKNELGIDCRQIISFLADIVPYNSYLKSILIENKCINSENEFFDRFKIKSIKYDILSKLLTIIILIGKLRLSYIYPGFLSSVTILIGNLIDSSAQGDIEFMYNIFREIVFTKPSHKVLVFITKVLREIKTGELLNLFCKLPDINGLRTRLKKSFVLFSKDCCIMQVFCNLYTNQILNTNNFPQHLESDLNFLCFVCNLFKYNLNWFSCQNNKHDQCIFCTCTLSMRIMLKNLQNIADNQITSYDKQCGQEIFHCSLQLLRLLKFNLYAVIQGNFRLLTDYYKIISILDSHKHLLANELCTTTGDLSDLYNKDPSETLEGIKFNQKYWSKNIL